MHFLNDRRFIMKKYFAGKSVLPFIVFFIASCVTINIYFPAAAVEKAADRIVEEVWGEKAGELKKQDEQRCVCCVERLIG